MTSREKILSAVKTNQPASPADLPQRSFNATNGIAHTKFVEILQAIGGDVYEVKSYEEIRQVIKEHFSSYQRIVSTLPDLNDIADTLKWRDEDPHSLQDVDLAIIGAEFGVAENGAVWVTEKNLGLRVLPFISQHLAVVIERGSILPDMHAAYTKIGDQFYGYGAFIAGPSKTADIEQSLVLGAHGPKSMTVFVIDRG